MRLKSCTMACWRLFLILVSVAGSSSTLQAKQLAVVADVANPTTNVTTAELKKILNASTQTWPDARPIKIVLRDPFCADMQVVLHRLLVMTPQQAQTFVEGHRG